ncbi:MAG: hypothetical protein OXG59_06800 [Gammaproteobacteria bacterium]|nr:hypothetical protein [Gammaproteobacteria bacterium]
MSNQSSDALAVADRHYRRALSNRSQPWRLIDPSHPTSLDALLASMTEIALAFRAMTDFMARGDSLSQQGGGQIAQSAVRQMSVSIRKLCIDKQGAALMRAIDSPTFHPLGGEKGRFRQVSIAWTAERQEWGLEFEDGRHEKIIVPDRSFEIQVGRLYGIVFLGDEVCALHSPFDFAAEPICLNAWLDLGVLQVNSVSYTVCDLLKVIANAEGAHYTDALPALIGRGVNPEDIGKGGEMKYSLANAVRFGFFTYPQIIVFFTGLYLIRRVQELLQSLQTDSGMKTSRMLDALQLQMAELNTNFFAQLPLRRNVHELLIYGKPDGSGNRSTRQAAYRVWSGSKHWDAPAAD